MNRRWRRTATAVLALAVAGSAVTGCGSSAPDAGDLAQDERAKVCDRLGTELVETSSDLTDEERAMPEELVTFADDGQWLYLYLGDHTLVSCFGMEGQEVFVEVARSGMVDPGAVWLDGAVLGHVAWSFEGGQSYLVVGVPAGTEQLEVVLPDGTQVDGVPAGDRFGDRFVAWLPSHPGDGLGAIEELTIRAYTEDTVYIVEDERDVTSQPRIDG